MKKRVLGVLLSVVLTLSAMGIAVPLTTMADTMMVVTVGADLTEAEKNMILNYFNVAGKSYRTITVTNNDEWAHLGSYMSRDVIGYRTISCALIRPMTSGGIQVKTANLTYVTSNMIASNLATAGVTNCEVLAAAPFQVSGTGALTGTLMAYENLSGVTLDESKKQAAAQEFATTYELGQTIGQQEAQQIVNDVKMQVINGTLEEDNSITNEKITEIVNDVVNNYTNNVSNVTNTTNTSNNTYNTGLTESDVAALQSLAVQIAKESYEKGTLDALAQIQKTLEGQTQTASSAATTQIEQNAAPTVDSSTATAAADTADTQLSAADEALAQDSMLTATNDSALAQTSDDGQVVTSSTSKIAIVGDTATDLDEQIKQEQEQIQEQAQEQVQEQPQEASVNEIPQPDDMTVFNTDSTAPSDPAGAEEITAETAAPADVTGEENVAAEAETAAPSDYVQADTEAAAQDTEAAGGDDQQAAEASSEAGEAAGSFQITAADVDGQTVTFTTGSTAGNGTQPASGISPVEVVVPYENLTPHSGALHVNAASSGSEAAYLDISADEPNLVLLTSADTPSVPAGSTKILMLPRDNNDISGNTVFAPAAGESYTYTFSAQFETPDGMLTIEIDNYDPFYGNPVSSAGFSVSGSCLNRTAAEGLTGTVLFPEGSVYATVAADAQSMAFVSVTGADGSMQSGVTDGADGTVSVTPSQSGTVTLSITYYSAAPEEGMEPDPAMQTGTAQYSIFFR